MSKFMSKYLESLLTEEEMKKHGLTRRDLEFIKKEHLMLEGMLSDFQASILNRKDAEVEIQDELDKAQMFAEYLSFLGDSYLKFISESRSKISDIDGFYLEDCISLHPDKMAKLIIYLLSRTQKEYESSPIYHHEYYSDAFRDNRIMDHFNLLCEKGDSKPGFGSLGNALAYIEAMCEKQQSFILTGLDTHNNDESFEMLFSPLLEHAQIGYLGKKRWKALCFMGDDTFRDVIMKLLLFSDIHGLSLTDITSDNKEEYANAIEGMDTSSYLVRKDGLSYLTLAKRNPQK